MQHLVSWLTHAVNFGLRVKTRQVQFGKEMPRLTGGQMKQDAVLVMVTTMVFCVFERLQSYLTSDGLFFTER